jgi:5-methylcytosine-specific restriction endonuclease McrA
MESVAANDNQLTRYGPWVPTAAMARKVGAKTFFTGVQCKNGHVAERYTCDGKCVPCKLAYRKAYYDLNAEEVRRKARESHYLNRDHNLARMKQYSNDNNEFIGARMSVYNEKNRDHRVEMAKEWHAENPERASEYRRQRSEAYAVHARNRRPRIKGNGGSHTAEDIGIILTQQGFRCAACGADVSDRNTRHVDHIVAISKGGSNWPENLQVLCAPCNLSKGDSSFEDFIGRLAQRAAA